MDIVHHGLRLYSTDETNSHKTMSKAGHMKLGAWRPLAVVNLTEKCDARYRSISPFLDSSARFLREARKRPASSENGRAYTEATCGWLYV